MGLSTGSTTTVEHLASASLRECVGMGERSRARERKGGGEGECERARKKETRV